VAEEINYSILFYSIGRAEQDRQNRAGRTGQAERERQNPETQNRKGITQNRTGKSALAEHDRQNRTGKTEQDKQNRTGRTRHGPCMYMLQGHAPEISSMEKQHLHKDWTCSIDMQQGHAVWK
jgi:hypothetical protein